MSIDGFEDVPRNDEKSLQKAVAHQPVSVAIAAGGREFQLYKSVNKLAEAICLCYHTTSRLLILTRLRFFITGCLQWKVHHKP